MSYSDLSRPVATDDEELNYAPVVKDPEPEFSSTHYNIRMLSYSGRLLLRTCPRKYELTKLKKRFRDDTDENGHLAFGTVVGNGIQCYLETGSLDRAIFRSFCDWNTYLDDERGLKSKKTYWHAVDAIQKFVNLRHSELGAYDLAYFDGKPATELGFSILCGNGYRYRGKIDALLIHKISKKFLVLECKTTGYASVDEAMYKNSDQAIGYGVVIDAVAHQMGVESNDYNILYPVYKTKQAEWEAFFFPKSNNQRALWLQSLLLEIGHIRQYEQLGYWPAHGESCYHFNKQCAFYGVCQLSNQNLVGPVDKIPIVLDKPGDYPLIFSISDLVQAQIEKAE